MQTSSGDALRVVNVNTLLRKRDLASKQGTAKKQKTNELSLDDSRKLSKYLRNQSKQLTSQHTQQLERVHKFYTSEITSLQNGWDIERQELEERIASLETLLEKNAIKNEYLKEMGKRLQQAENKAENYAMLYQVS